MGCSKLLSCSALSVSLQSLPTRSLCVSAHWLLLQAHQGEMGDTVCLPDFHPSACRMLAGAWLCAVPAGPQSTAGRRLCLSNYVK